MLRLGRIIRLTAREVERLTLITGIAPENVRTLADFNTYIERCKRHYKGVSRDTRFLLWLIERERRRCLAFDRPVHFSQPSGD